MNAVQAWLVSAGLPVFLCYQSRVAAEGFTTPVARRKGFWRRERLMGRKGAITRNTLLEARAQQPQGLSSERGLRG